LNKKSTPFKILQSKDFLKDVKKVLKSGDRSVLSKIQRTIDELKIDPYNKRPNMDIKLISKKISSIIIFFDIFSFRCKNHNQTHINQKKHQTYALIVSDQIPAYKTSALAITLSRKYRLRSSGVLKINHSSTK